MEEKYAVWSSGGLVVRREAEKADAEGTLPELGVAASMAPEWRHSVIIAHWWSNVCSRRLLKMIPHSNACQKYIIGE